MCAIHPQGPMVSYTKTVAPLVRTTMAADRQHCVLIANIVMFLFSYIIGFRSHLREAVSGLVTAVMDSLSLSSGAPSSMVKTMMVIMKEKSKKSKNNPNDKGEIEKLLKDGAEIAGRIFSSEG